MVGMIIYINIQFECNKQMTWTDALMHCIRHNMSLATFNSREETARGREAVADVLGNLNWFWTGGVYQEYWMWIPTGQRIGPYVNWHSGSPDRDRFLVLSYVNESNTDWTSYPQTSQFHVMCEYFAEPGTTAQCPPCATTELTSATIL